MLRISESVDGARVRPRRRAAPGHDEHLDAGREGGEDRRDSEGGRADEKKATTADPVAERAHRDQGAGHQEAVDVGDPEQLRARRLELRGQRRHRQIENGQVHRVEEARKGDHREPDPLAPPRPGNPGRRHALDLRFRSAHSHETAACRPIGARSTRIARSRPTNGSGGRAVLCLDQLRQRVHVVLFEGLDVPGEQLRVGLVRRARRLGRRALASSVLRALCSALLTDATDVSRSSAASEARQRSTSQRIRTARCLDGRCWRAATNGGGPSLASP